MSRKPKRGYYVKGHFVAEGSELDLELKREAKGFTDVSKTDLKRESDRLQALGEALLTLRADLSARIDLPDTLIEAVAEARRITNFEGRRRQMQYIGKLMRTVDTSPLAEAVAESRLGSARQTLALHRAEKWREDLIAEEEAVTRWVAAHPDCDAQHLRNLVRRARAERLEALPDSTEGQGMRQGKASRELFKAIRSSLDAVPGQPS